MRAPGAEPALVTADADLAPLAVSSDGTAIAYPRRLGAYGYYDDHPIALRRHGPTARYLEDRCSMFVGLVPRVSTFYVSHRFLVQSLEDGFNWAEALHREGIKCERR